MSTTDGSVSRSSFTLASLYYRLPSPIRASGLLLKIIDFSIKNALFASHSFTQNPSIQKFEIVHHCKGLINARLSKSTSRTFIYSSSSYCYLNVKEGPSSMVSGLTISSNSSIEKLQTVHHVKVSSMRIHSKTSQVHSSVRCRGFLI